jgi:sugar/nucleoside kinase (ribokinase family)
MVSFDVNYRPSLWPHPDAAISAIRRLLPLADVVKINEDELRLLTGTDDPDAGGAALLAAGPALVVITLGARGSAYRSAAASGFVPAFAVPTVDAIGCGDAFMAGVLVGLLGGARTARGQQRLDDAYPAPHPALRQRRWRADGHTRRRAAGAADGGRSGRHFWELVMSASDE